MAFTYSKLAESTVGAGGTSAITFNNIPQNYTDLVVKISGRTNFAQINDTYKITFNGTTSGYSGRFIQGNGSAASSSTAGTAAIDSPQTVGNSATASTFGNTEIYIPNYAGSTNKSISIDTVGENNATSALSNLYAALWANVSAISSISIGPQNGTLLLEHSTATLYGIRVEL
jgi:hypothetical protein